MNRPTYFVRLCTLILLLFSVHAIPTSGQTTNSTDIDHQTYLPLVQGPTPAQLSSDLINAALQNNEISAETALIYHVFAAFGDARLPERFRSDDSAVYESDVLGKAVNQFDQLSAQAQAILAPFLIPPAYENSWVYRQSNQRLLKTASDERPTCGAVSPSWTYLDTRNGKVRIWYERN